VAGVTSTRPRSANVLLITTDGQRYDTLGATGNRLVKTPDLDALAARGTPFSRGYIQNPVCIPSRACIQTGRYVHQRHAGALLVEQTRRGLADAPPAPVTSATSPSAARPCGTSSRVVPGAPDARRARPQCARCGA
jgi:hypothetical protein